MTGGTTSMTNKKSTKVDKSPPKTKSKAVSATSAKASAAKASSKAAAKTEAAKPYEKAAAAKPTTKAVAAKSAATKASAAKPAAKSAAKVAVKPAAKTAAKSAAVPAKAKSTVAAKNAESAKAVSEKASAKSTTTKRSAKASDSSLIKERNKAADGTALKSKFANIATRLSPNAEDSANNVAIPSVPQSKVYKSTLEELRAKTHAAAHASLFKTIKSEYADMDDDEGDNLSAISSLLNIPAPKWSDEVSSDESSTSQKSVASGVYNDSSSSKAKASRRASSATSNHGDIRQGDASSAYRSRQNASVLSGVFSATDFSTSTEDERAALEASHRYENYYTDLSDEGEENNSYTALQGLSSKKQSKTAKSQYDEGSKHLAYYGESLGLNLSDNAEDEDEDYEYLQSEDLNDIDYDDDLDDPIHAHTHAKQQTLGIDEDDIEDDDANESAAVKPKGKDQATKAIAKASKAASKSAKSSKKSSDEDDVDDEEIEETTTSTSKRGAKKTTSLKAASKKAAAASEEEDDDSFALRGLSRNYEDDEDDDSPLFADVYGLDSDEDEENEILESEDSEDYEDDSDYVDEDQDDESYEDESDEELYDEEDAEDYESEDYESEDEDDESYEEDDDESETDAEDDESYDEDDESEEDESAEESDNEDLEELEFFEDEDAQDYESYEEDDADLFEEKDEDHALNIEDDESEDDSEAEDADDETIYEDDDESEDYEFEEESDDSDGGLGLDFGDTDSNESEDEAFDEQYSDEELDDVDYDDLSDTLSEIDYSDSLDELDSLIKGTSLTQSQDDEEELDTLDVNPTFGLSSSRFGESADEKILEDSNSAYYDHIRRMKESDDDIGLEELFEDDDESPSDKKKPATDAEKKQFDNIADEAFAGATSYYDYIKKLRSEGLDPSELVNDDDFDDDLDEDNAKENASQDSAAAKAEIDEKAVQNSTSFGYDVGEYGVLTYNVAKNVRYLKKYLSEFPGGFRLERYIDEEIGAIRVPRRGRGRITALEQKERNALDNAIVQMRELAKRLNRRPPRVFWHNDDVEAYLKAEKEENKRRAKNKEMPSILEPAIFQRGLANLNKRVIKNQVHVRRTYLNNESFTANVKVTINGNTTEQKVEIADSEFNTMLTAYMMNYHRLVNTIIINSDKRLIVEEAIEEILERYRNFFEADYRNFFYIMFHSAPRVLFFMMRYPIMRELYLGRNDVFLTWGIYSHIGSKALRERVEKLPAYENVELQDRDYIRRNPLNSVHKALCNLARNNTIEDYSEKSTGRRGQKHVPKRRGIQPFVLPQTELRAKLFGMVKYVNHDMELMANAFLSLATSKDRLRALFGDNVKRFSLTDPSFAENWNALEPATQPCMIIHVGSEIVLRNNNGERALYEQEDIDRKFLVLFGIQFKARSVFQKVHMSIPSREEVNKEANRIQGGVFMSDNPLTKSKAFKEMEQEDKKFEILYIRL